MNPHVCPVCSGRGFVPQSFYLGNGPGSSSTGTGTETCRTCNGTGVVWAPDEQPQWAVPAYPPATTAAAGGGYQVIGAQ